MIGVYHAVAGALIRRGRAALALVDAFVRLVTKPGASNTGNRLPTLTTHVGDYVCNTPGELVTRMRIEGRLIINAADVVARDNDIVGFASVTSSQEQFLVDINSGGTNALVEFNTIRPRVANQASEGSRINGVGSKLRRNNISNVVDHIGIACADVVIEDNYCHSAAYISPASTQPTDNQTHNDVIQFHPGAFNWSITGNTLRAQYGDGGTHSAPDHKVTFDRDGIKSPSGWDNVSSAVLMFGSNLGTLVTPTSKCNDNWMEGGFIPVNGGAPTNSNFGEMKRNKFDGDAFKTGTYSATPVFDSSTYTISLDPTNTTDCGESVTADRNVYVGTSIAVNVRRNG